MQVTIRLPSVDDRQIIKNLYVFYRYDLMPFLAGRPGGAINHFGVIGSEKEATHEQGVADIDVWWTKPNILLPMLICADTEPAGFVMLATRPYAHPPVDYIMEEFFVVNKFRRQGVGFLAVARLFAQYPGMWELCWLSGNVVAEQFWRNTIAHLGFHPKTHQVTGDENQPAVLGFKFNTARTNAEP